MKRNLTKVSDDTLPPKGDYAPRYKDPSGNALHGVYVRQYKKTEDKLYINNGHLMSKYKYPRIERKFTSQMLNDFNLHLCGGWAWHGVNSDTVLIERVANKQKPMGFISTFTEKVDKLLGLIDNTNLEVMVRPSKYRSDQVEIAIANQGKLNDLFDLSSLMEDYIAYQNATGRIRKIEDHTCYSVVPEEIYRFAEYELKDFFSFDYVNHLEDWDIMITGLILGYPIETTVSIMWM